jgi:MoxR-like ATPase
VSEDVEQYIVDLTQATRQDSRVQIGASPRGTLALMKLARTYAALRGRDFVTPDDVKAMAIPALSHRLILRPELWITRVAEEDIIRDLLNKVPTPKAEA